MKRVPVWGPLLPMVAGWVLVLVTFATLRVGGSGIRSMVIAALCCLLLGSASAMFPLAYRFKARDSYFVRGLWINLSASRTKAVDVAVVCIEAMQMGLLFFLFPVVSVDPKNDVVQIVASLARTFSLGASPYTPFSLSTTAALAWTLAAAMLVLRAIRFRGRAHHHLLSSIDVVLQIPVLSALMVMSVAATNQVHPVWTNQVAWNGLHAWGGLVSFGIMGVLLPSLSLVNLLGTYPACVACAVARRPFLIYKNHTKALLCIIVAAAVSISQVGRSRYDIVNVLPPCLFLTVVGLWCYRSVKGRPYMTAQCNALAETFFGLGVPFLGLMGISLAETPSAAVSVFATFFLLASVAFVGHRRWKAARRRYQRLPRPRDHPVLPGPAAPRVVLHRHVEVGNPRNLLAALDIHAPGLDSEAGIPPGHPRGRKKKLSHLMSSMVDPATVLGPNKPLAAIDNQDAAGGKDPSGWSTLLRMFLKTSATIIVREDLSRVHDLPMPPSDDEDGSQIPDWDFNPDKNDVGWPVRILDDSMPLADPAAEASSLTLTEASENASLGGVYTVPYEALFDRAETLLSGRELPLRALVELAKIAPHREKIVGMGGIHLFFTLSSSLDPQIRTIASNGYQLLMSAGNGNGSMGAGGSSGRTGGARSSGSQPNLQQHMSPDTAAASGVHAPGFVPGAPLSPAAPLAPTLADGMVGAASHAVAVAAGAGHITTSSGVQPPAPHGVVPARPSVQRSPLSSFRDLLDTSTYGPIIPPPPPPQDNSNDRELLRQPTSMMSSSLMGFM